MSNTPTTDAAEYEIQEVFESYEGLNSAPTKVVSPEDMRALELKYNNQISHLLNELNSYENKIIFYIDGKYKAESELLTLANGDKLPEDASNNALIIQDYISELKKKE